MQAKTEVKSRQLRWKQLLGLAWPLIIANSFWNLQLTIDRIFLGHYQTEALGAAMAVMGVFWTPMALLQQTVAYVSSFVAQYFGAKEWPEIGKAVWQALILAVAGGLLFYTLMPLAGPLFQAFGHSPTVATMETAYFQALCHSALPTALVAVVSGFFSGLGQAQKVMWINGVGLVGNVVFDYLMIFGNFGFPELGIAGAGYATAIATWCAAIFALYLVFQKKYEEDFAIRRSFGLHRDLLKRFIRFGLPSGLQWALEGLAFTVFLLFVGRFVDGDAALASSSIVVTIMMLAILPVLGLAQAASIELGHKLGEDKSDEAEAIVWSAVQLGFLYIFIMAVSFLSLPQFYLSWFKSDASQALWPVVTQMVPTLLLFVAFFVNFDCLNLILSFSLKGAGDTKFVSLVALSLPWPLMVLPTYLLQQQVGAVYWAWGAASLFGATQAMVFLWRFRQGRWKSMRVIFD